MSIIFPGMSYDKSPTRRNLSTLRDWRTDACVKLFNEIVANPDHKLEQSSTT